MFSMWKTLSAPFTIPQETGSWKEIKNKAMNDVPWSVLFAACANTTRIHKSARLIPYVCPHVTEQKNSTPQFR